MDAKVSRSVQDALRALDKADADVSKLVEIHGRFDASRQLGELFVQLSEEAGGVATNSEREAFKLQATMQRYNQLFSILSNMAKEKHETMKGVISNMRP